LVGEHIGAEISQNGFFIVELDAPAQVSADEALRELEVDARTRDGTDITGSLRLLPSPDEHYLVGWQSAVQLEVGTSLSLNMRIKADQNAWSVSGVYVGEGWPSLSAGTLDFQRWLDFRHGVGSLIPCADTSQDSCEAATLVHDSEEQLLAVDMSWTPPETAGYFCWKARVEPIDTAPTTLSAPLLYSAPGRALPLGRLLLPNRTQEYCARLIVTDVLSGAEVSQQFCQGPRVSALVADDAVGSCPEPPNQGRASTWCRLNSKSLHRACLPDSGTEPSCRLGRAPRGGSLALLALLGIALLRRCTPRAFLPDRAHEVAERR
jgi:hypothetical protein